MCTLNITQIVVLDWYGGPHYVSITDYYNSNDDSVVELNKFYQIDDNSLLDSAAEIYSQKDEKHIQKDRHIKIKINKKHDEINIEI